MSNQGSLFRYSQRGISRRNLIRGVGAAGAVLSSGLWTPARAHNDNHNKHGHEDHREDHEDHDENTTQCAFPLPIPHTTAGPFGPLHFYFPGPIDGSAVPSLDSTGAHPEGRDPSTITNFEGFVGQVDLTFGGTAIDTGTGKKADYTFHTDTRFMRGEFIASDQRRYEGTFAFI